MHKTSTNPFIEYIQKKRRKQFWKMSHIRMVSLFLIAAIVLAILSYFFRYFYPWGSSLLQAFAVSIVTGLVLYILNNIRGQEEKYLEYTISQLKQLYEYAQQVYNAKMNQGILKIFPQQQQDYYKSNEYLIDAFDAAKKYVYCLGKLDFRLFKKFVGDTNIDIFAMKDQILKYEEEIINIVEYNDGQNLIRKLIEIIQESVDWIGNELSNSEIQLSQIQKYPF